VHTKDDLDKLLQSEAFARAERIQLVEIMMEQLDAPRALKVQAEMSGKTNAYVRVTA
jgi:pyruvate decarboxylase